MELIDNQQLTSITINKKNLFTKEFLTEELIGCSLPFFIDYLRSTMDETMTWDMYMKGILHIEHEKPCCSFDLSNIEEVKKCFHYTNLRLLHGTDNCAKASEDKKLSIYSKITQETNASQPQTQSSTNQII